MFSPKYLITIIICAIPAASHSEDTYEKRMAALKEIRSFAESTCVPVGNRTDIEVKGDLDAGLSSLLEKFVDLKVSTNGTFKKSEYLGVLQDRITGEANDPAGCKMKVMTEWKSEFLPVAGQ